MHCQVGTINTAFLNRDAIIAGSNSRHNKKTTMSKYKPSIERLEDRLVLTDFTLANLTQAALAAEIINANQNPGLDRILFDPADLPSDGSMGVIAVSSALPTITDPVEIIGPGRDKLALDGAGWELNNNNIGADSGLFTVDYSPTLFSDDGTSFELPTTFSGITIRNVGFKDGAGFYTNSGGAIHTYEPTYIYDSRFSNNSAGVGGAIRAEHRSSTNGGTNEDGYLHIEGTEFIDNDALQGGAIFHYGGYVDFVPTILPPGADPLPAEIDSVLGFVVIDSQFVGNSTESGSAVEFRSDSEPGTGTSYNLGANFYGVTMDDNEGGALSVKGGILRVHEGVFINNTDNSSTAGIFMGPSNVGGYVETEIYITDTEISGNRIDGSSGGILNGIGASFTLGTDGFLEIKDSTIADNGNDNTSVVTGGGLSLSVGEGASAKLIQNTISGNDADTGGGISIELEATNTGTVAFVNNTIVNNKSGSSTKDGVGGGIYFENTESSTNGKATFSNTIVAANSAFTSGVAAASDIVGPGGSTSVVNTGTSINNLIGGGGAGGIQDGNQGNLVSSTYNDLSTGVELSVLPALSASPTPGQTRVHVPLAGSPVIDEGDDASAMEELLILDQRDIDRFIDGDPNVNGTEDIVDIGSVEYFGGSNLLCLVVTILEDIVADDDELSLREAVIQANAHNGPVQIKLGEGVHVLTITGTENDADKNVLLNDLDIEGDVKIIGQGPGVTIIDNSGLTSSESRAFDAKDGSTNLEFMGLTIAGEAAVDDKGMAIRMNEGGDLLIEFSAIVNHSSSDDGGSVYVEDGNLTILESVFTADSTSIGSGGAVAVKETTNGTASITIGRSVFALNAGGASAGAPNVAVLGNAATNNLGRNLYDEDDGGFFDMVGVGTDHEGPTDYVVTTIADTFDNSDNDSALSLREAIALTNGGNDPNSDGDKDIWLPAWDFALTRVDPDADFYDISYNDLDVVGDLNIRGVNFESNVRWQSGITPADSDRVFDMMGDYDDGGDGDGFWDSDISDFGQYYTDSQPATLNQSGRSDFDSNGTVDNVDYGTFAMSFGGEFQLTNVDYDW